MPSPPCSPHESCPAPRDGGVDIGGGVVDQGGNHLGVAFAGGHHQGGRGGHQAGPFLNRVQRFKDNIGTSLFGSAPEARSSLVVSALPQFAASQRSQLSWDESKVELMLYLMSGLLLENSWGRGGEKGLWSVSCLPPIGSFPGQSLNPIGQDCTGHCPGL